MDKSLPFFSVIVPVYNVSAYLDKCLQSILQQTFSDYEVILVNDGSTDNSGEIAEKYASKYNHFQAITQANRGLSGARNTGLKYARGEYVVFIDSDDWVSPNHLSCLKEQADKHAKPDLIYFDCFAYNEDTEEFVDSWASPFIVDKVFTDMRGRRRLLAPCFAWLKIYRRQFLTDHNLSFIEGILFEDNPLNFRCVTLAQTIVSTKQKLYYYRQRSGSIMHSVFTHEGPNTKIFDILTVIEDEVQFLKSQRPKKFWRDCCTVYLLNQLLEHFNRTHEALKDQYLKRGRRIVRQLKITDQVFEWLNPQRRQELARFKTNVFQRMILGG